MGAACCVAARDKTIQQGSSGEILHRNNWHSPSWSFRWDNRVGVAGEETNSTGWLSEVPSRNDVFYVKSVTDVSAHVLDGGSSLESYRIGAWRKSPSNHETSKNLTTSSGQSIGMDVSDLELKQSTNSSQMSDRASFKRSPSMYSTPSVGLFPLSSQSLLLPPSSTPIGWSPLSPGHLLVQQPSNTHSPNRASPSLNSDIEEGHIPYGNHTASTESTRGSYTFSELNSVSQRGRWSFDSDSFSLTYLKMSRASGWNSRSISMDLQTCRICSKRLTEKSAWSSQKIIAGNELSVVAVLICGHVYHAECLEAITSEVNKYDPDCPVCISGGKQTLKLCEKMLKAEKDLKAKYNKQSKNRVAGSDDSFDYWKSGSLEGRSPKLSVSSSLKLSAAKPFLKRHFSFGSRSSNHSGSGAPSGKKKGLFWAKSSRQ